MSHATLDSLRQQLRERFPAAHLQTPQLHPPQTATTADTLKLCFSQGSITELNSPTHSAGLHLLLAALLHQEPKPDPIPELALIDATDQFDPASFPTQDCLQLLWLRCQAPLQSLQACDLLLRDGNLPRIILDLSLCPRLLLNTLPKSAWYRFKQSIQASQCCLLIFTPQPLIPCATHRLEITSELHLDDFSSERGELFDQLAHRETGHRNDRISFS